MSTGAGSGDQESKARRDASREVGDYARAIRDDLAASTPADMIARVRRAMRVVRVVITHRGDVPQGFPDDERRLADALSHFLTDGRSPIATRPPPFCDDCDDLAACGARQGCAEDQS